MNKFCVIFECRDEEDNSLLECDVHGPYHAEHTAREQQKKIAYRIIDEWCADNPEEDKAELRAKFDKAPDQFYLDQCEVKVMALKNNDLRQSYLGHESWEKR